MEEELEETERGLNETKRELGREKSELDHGQPLLRLKRLIVWHAKRSERAKQMEEIER